MNVCVQNTVFLRRISDRFFFLAFTLYYVGTFQILGWGKTENPSEYPARPSLNVQDEIPSFISSLLHILPLSYPPSFISSLLPTSYPLWGKMGCYFKKNGLIFFNLYLLFIGINLKSETFLGKKSLG